MSDKPPPILRPDPGASEVRSPMPRRFKLALVVMFVPLIIGTVYATWHDFGWVGLAVLGVGGGWLGVIFWLLVTSIDGRASEGEAP